MSLLKRATATGALLILPLSLAACGGGGAKPSKADAQAGLSKILKSSPETSSLTAAQNDKITKCVIDKTYDKLTTKTLKAMASGDDNSKGDEKDKSTLNSASTACGNALAAAG